MPHPVARPSGVFHLNVRVPADLMKVVPGTRISLPRDGAVVGVRATDKVVMSLLTKDPLAAKASFTMAYAALCRRFDAVRRGPVSLSHKDVVALAGVSYRRRTARMEAECDPDRLESERADMEDAIAEWRFGHGDGLGEVSPEIAEFLAAIQRPSGAHLLAFERRADIEWPDGSVTYAEALEHLFGEDADALCAERQLIVDSATRAKLLRQIGDVVRLAARRRVQTTGGDFSPDANLLRFPAVEPIGTGPAAETARPTAGAKVTIDTLFARWKVFNADHVKPSTARRYSPSVASLSSFLGGKDVRIVVKADIERWADHRRDVERIGAATVNDNDLVAASSLFSFATSRESDADAAGEKRPLRADNPAKGVKLKVPAVQVVREKRFRSAEASAILALAHGVVPDPSYPKASACRRFAPFICAYSGARIQEVGSLGKDIWLEARIWVMRFPKTKNGLARTVPIRGAILDEGLLDYWRCAGPGLLFAGDRAQKANASRTQAEQRASEMATWITSRVALQSGAKPNHGWRHLFVARAQGPAVQMSREMACAIAGHNQVRDAHSVYEHFTIEEMKTELDRFPAYEA